MRLEHLSYVLATRRHLDDTRSHVKDVFMISSASLLTSFSIMTSRSTIPSALSSYIRVPPPQSLVLCTHVLGALNNWVLLRYLYACLGSTNAGRNGPDGDDGAARSGYDTSVILVSWMRDLAFWRTEARRTVVRQYEDCRPTEHMLTARRASTYQSYSSKDDSSSSMG